MILYLCSLVLFMLTDRTIQVEQLSWRNKTNSFYGKIIAVSKNLTKESIMMKLIPIRTRDGHETREGRKPSGTGRDGTGRTAGKDYPLTPETTARRGLAKTYRRTNVPVMAVEGTTDTNPHSPPSKINCLPLLWCSRFYSHCDADVLRLK